MAAFRSLANGKQKLTLFAEKPTNPGALTAALLNAAIDASCAISKDDFQWGATDSETVNDSPLCVSANVEVFGADNLQSAFTVYRFSDTESLQFDPVADEVYEAVKTKGTVLWGALRESAKDSGEDWETGDEYDLLEILVDNPQRLPEMSGYLKRRINARPQNSWLGKKVVTGA